jgi:hypothetical protein
MNFYYTGETGVVLPNGVFSTTPEGQINPFTGANGTVFSGGWGEVYGLYFNYSGNPSFGLSQHTTGTAYSAQPAPFPTGNIYYPSAYFGSGINLYFYIKAISGSSIGVISGNHYLITGTGVNGLNCEYFSNGTVKYNGPSGYLRPSGLLMHQDSLQLLPNYAYPTSAVYTGNPIYPYKNCGGIYPSLLRDNIVTFNLQITWSAPCGDADGCN